MADLIDRQAAIDRIRGTGYADQIKENVIMTLMCLPSAQPEYTEQDMRYEFSAGYDCGMEAAQHKIIHCKDCKHWEYDVIFADGWCRGKQQGNPEWYCADAERRTDENNNSI